MRFWDSSALVSLHVAQDATETVRGLFARDPQIVAWALSDVEVRSALCRLRRDGALTDDALQDATARLEAFWKCIHVVSSVDPVKSRAKRLLGVHSLRAADALQLGAALAAVYDEPFGQEFVCLDQRLSDAAQREGFAVVP